MILPTNQTELDEIVKNFHDSSQSKKYVINNVKEKIDKLDEYFWKWNIRKVVVGVSGGIDSAVVLALLDRCDLDEIHAVNITFKDFDKVYDPSYYQLLKEKIPCVIYHEVDLTGVNYQLLHKLKLTYTSKQFWNLSSQTSYAMRYLAFFAFAQEEGAVTIGTTNADEMGYAGWFGKNSDMMVDIQPISDLCKGEVVEWARFLEIPEEIINRTPTGDLIDGSTDEDNFGCTYDELGWFTHYMNIHEHKTDSLNEFILTKFDKVIKLHNKNLHKYQGQGFNPIFI